MNAVHGSSSVNKAINVIQSFFPDVQLDDNGMLIERKFIFLFSCIKISGAGLEVQHHNTEESLISYKGKQCIYKKLRR